MGFFHGLMLEAKKEISERFDNDESRYKVAWDIIDKRWDSKLKTPLHLAGQRRNKNFNPAKWWLNHGTNTPNLRILASKILNLTCSSSACERNWSVFEQVHTKRRNRLLHDRMRDLVFVKFNSKLRGKKERIDRDPLEREVDDVVGDDDNEFITGIVPLPNDVVEPAQDGRSQGEQTSQAQVQVQAKRKRSWFRAGSLAFSCAKNLGQLGGLFFIRMQASG
uniref:HAT C-terminal dimerisation domain-containing protein n=1 Tax=Zea mays TaxID=4577 RepID=A0A804MW54_MAIZE